MFLPPTKLNFELLIKKSRRSEKGMRESCLVHCYSGIQSLFEVVLLYTFYTIGAETGNRKPGYYRSQERLE